jgi:hypothetical protein
VVRYRQIVPNAVLLYKSMTVHKTGLRPIEQVDAFGRKGGGLFGGEAEVGIHNLSLRDEALASQRF